MDQIIPSKDSVIQGCTAAGKFFSVIMAVCSTSGEIPPKFAGIAFLVFMVASAFKEISASILAVVRGDKITLAPPAPTQPK
jgi:hypothetical protein